MKCQSSVVVFVCVASLLPCSAVKLVREVASPVPRVVQLLSELKAKVESDGKAEQASYDKYACWCEDTLGRKANDISKGKTLIEELSAEIVKLSAEVASHAADIKQLEKDVAANLESQREATEVRDQERNEYQGDKTESEQCIGALEAAIKVLTGAGTAKKGFLETIQEAQLLSVVAGVRGLLARPAAVRSTTSKDLDIVRRFVEQPQDFMGDHAAGMSAAQIANNPFGDYAPQSTQIQGILRGMYDAFAADLEKSNAEEAERQKAFEALMATKKEELSTLQKTLEKETVDKTEKSSKEADDKALRDDTTAQLETDEAFFEKAKAGCQAKATEWAERTRLRTEELHGIVQAIEILKGGMDTFENASATLLQVSSRKKAASALSRAVVFSRLQSVASQHHSLNLHRAVLEAQSSGHFDAVIATIDKMIAVLRKEEQDDIQHRDRCQASQNKNKNDGEDLQHDIKKADAEMSQLATEKEALQTELDTLEEAIQDTKKSMEELLGLRNQAVAEFRNALKDDTEAVKLIGEAIKSLTKFYEKNKIAPSLVQAEPSYTIDADKAPETWKGSYGGRSSESHGIIAILSMIKEDIEKEIETTRQENMEAQGEYTKQRDALRETLSKQEASKTTVEEELAKVEGKSTDAEEFKNQKSSDLEAEDKLGDALHQDCSWVSTHFEKRQLKRKAEISGLVDAKGYLAGVESGSEV